MALSFYIDGELVGKAKAKACWDKSIAEAILRGFTSQENADAYWQFKATSEEARERIQELTCFDFGNLEVIRESD